MGKKKLSTLNNVLLTSLVNDAGTIQDPVKTALSGAGYPLSKQASLTVKVTDKRIQISDNEKKRKFVIVRDCQDSVIYLVTKSRTKSELTGMSLAERRAIKTIEANLKAKGVIGNDLRRAKIKALYEMRSWREKNLESIVSETIEGKLKDIYNVKKTPSK